MKLNPFHWSHFQLRHLNLVTLVLVCSLLKGRHFTTPSSLNECVSNEIMKKITNSHSNFTMAVQIEMEDLEQMRKSNRKQFLSISVTS
jgi:hypothetical protein